MKIRRRRNQILMRLIDVGEERGERSEERLISVPMYLLCNPVLP
jgi:hypothetical protein